MGARPAITSLRGTERPVLRKRLALAPSLTIRPSKATSLRLSAYLQRDPEGSYHSGVPADARYRVTMLDGNSTEVHGVGFAGVKGFLGGFGRGELGAFGEPAIELDDSQSSFDLVLGEDAGLAEWRAAGIIPVVFSLFLGRLYETRL